MEEIIFKEVGKRLKEAREKKNITLEQAGKKVDVHKSTVLRWENGKTEKIKLPILETLAQYYNVNPVWLMGYDVPMKRELYKKKDGLNNTVIEIPILQTIKSSSDYLAQENIIGTIDVETRLVGNGDDFFALKVKGDSMFPAIIEDDIVIVKKQADFENGDIVVTIINEDEATIKKVKKSSNGILLQPFNNNYEPLIFTYDEIESIPVIIIGIVKQLKREF